MSKLKEQITNIVNEVINTDSSVFLVDIIFSGVGHAPNKILIELDSDTGIQIEQCVEVSRLVGDKIEELNLIDTPYDLEVASAGVGEPLKLWRQYHKNIGRKIEVTLKDDKILVGKLVEVSEDAIKIDAETKSKNPKNKQIQITSGLPIAAADIKKTEVLVSFE